MQPQSKFVSLKKGKYSYKVHYLDWGNDNLPVLVCAHGLTRNSRDFDYLAKAICHQYRVIAIDYPGRGLSEWLENKNDYVIPFYVQLSVAFLDQLKLKSVNWLGTSMGGLIGIILTALNPDKVNRLLINDVGPEVPPAALQRIKDYLSATFLFENMTAFENHLRQIYQPFGQLKEQQWKHLAQYSCRLNSSGLICSNYDPGISVPFQNPTNEKTDLWEIWESINNAIYLLHGENSDILSLSMIEKMKQLQPGLQSRTIADVGHAPALMDTRQIRVINHWLNQN